MARRNAETTGIPSVRIKRLVLAIVLTIVLIAVLTLAIVLPIVLTRKASTTTSTSTTTTSIRIQVLTRCQPGQSTNQNVQMKTVKNQQKKVKMPAAPERIGDRVLMKNTYMVEFAPGKSARNYLGTVARSLKASENIQSTQIKKRCIIDSPLFSGVSFTVTANHSIESIEMMKDVVAIYPVYTVHLPKPMKSSISANALHINDTNTFNSYDLTGVDQIHKKFKNFGAGVKVAIIDSGIYYLHPALGGCFGPGCKVGFGYDFIGDAYSAHNTIIAPDHDPLDNCSITAHGTHVGGIIAANTTGITQTSYSSYVPFIGIAPQVTIGAYRVFSCSEITASDIISQAIYRAYQDKTDIISLSLGYPHPYWETDDAIAIQRVTDAGVYVIALAGNSGEGGLETTEDPSNLPNVMSIGSIDNKYTLMFNSSIIIAPDGKNILYQPGTVYGGWKSIINSTIVVNNPNATFNDGCFDVLRPVFSAVVLFFYNDSDTCDPSLRCNKAALQGAIGCLLYNANKITGATYLPSGSISLDDGLDIIAKVTANPSAIYTFTDLIAAASVTTGGTPSSFSSFGLTGDLFLKPQLSGIGGNVYSTVSPYAAFTKRLTNSYDIMSGTSMATPYVAGTLALFLASIGNPSPSTVSGYANNGICRPRFSTAMSIFQSTAQPVNIYNSSLLATTAQQGAGLVDAYHALTSTTILSTSELSLNDTVRKASSYKFNVTNIGNEAATYKISHQGAALATGKTANDDQLLGTPLYSADYANVMIDPHEFELKSEETREVTLRFDPPVRADSTLLPIYSGFIYVTNQISEEVVHLSYAGIVGDYGNARIFVRSSQTNITTGIGSRTSGYITENEVSILNATESIIIALVLAWPTRVCIIEAVLANETRLTDLNSGLGMLMDQNTDISLYLVNLARNTVIPVRYHTNVRVFFWGGYVWSNYLDKYPLDGKVNLSPGQYRIRFSALKHFGNASNPDDYDVYYTPVFNLVY